VEGLRHWFEQSNGQGLRDRGSVATAALVQACSLNLDDMVEVFLSFAPDKLDPNLPDISGWTPVMYAMAHSNDFEIIDSALALLAWHPLVRLDKHHPFFKGPRSWTYFGDAATRNVEMMKVLIATGKPLGWEQEQLIPNLLCEPLPLRDLVIRRRVPGCLELLESFTSDPERTRHSIRLEIFSQFTRLGETRVQHYIGALALDLFACTVLVCDSYLRIKPRQEKDGSDRERNEGARRFHSMLGALPLDLQMAMCHKVAGSGRCVILARESEPAFRWLALCWSSFFSVGTEENDTT